MIIADAFFKGRSLFQFLGWAEKAGVKIGQLSGAADPISPLEKIRIQSLSFEDLLGRPEANLDLHGMFSLIKGKRILITGVGGSIGSELVRQIGDFSPAHISLLDHNESLLYKTAMDLQEKHPYLSHRLLLIDVREKNRVHQIMAEEKPEFVFHAAALKHVPLVESHPIEGILTNLLGTRYVADACIANHVSAMVFISTDKAIAPTSVMGTTKRLAEAYCQSLDALTVKQNPHSTRFITVRFGNVLGSTGSVVPLFRRQIQRGGPVTVTHPEVTRYFMSVQEAIQLILQAAVLGMSDVKERGDIFVLDMGEPLSILELAENMIRLAGLRPHEDIKIAFTGLRPGEKLFEELFDENEKLLKTTCQSILTASPNFAKHAALAVALNDLEIAAYKQDVSLCLNMLKTLLPDYQQDPRHERPHQIAAAVVS